jgi:hypothetical protein
MMQAATRSPQYLADFEFERLFIEELGWDRHATELRLDVSRSAVTLNAFAEKRGVQVFECCSGNGTPLPDYNTRKKIEKQVAKSAFEHLIIFTDAERTVQIWQWVAREPGRPDAYREVIFRPKAQSGDLLLQKLQTIRFTLDEEESIDIAGASHRLRDAFDRDKVTKQFYGQFKEEHTAFLAFIQGIADQGDKDWYASLMLNRLMFVWFIQEKGFLDGDKGYLRSRLERVREMKGKGSFHAFYRYFLLALFHQGFGKPPATRDLDPDLKKLLGKVPYLNGGLFDPHQIERDNPDIQIPDEAFQQLFDFFGGFDWHLDTRTVSSGREINPDVLGYIFEKFINQKQMGAYYTKEDITEYMAKNVIVPVIFDSVKEGFPAAFEPNGEMWNLLGANPDRYIYPAVRQGVVTAKGKTAPAPSDIAAADALPTETWREFQARRAHCLEQRKRLAGGKIADINALVTENLHIRQFAEDVIAECADPKLLIAFWRAIRGLSVLDPTCGSGAFLFAALAVLVPLYEACLTRMEGFVEDAATGTHGSPTKILAEFTAVLDETAKHPSREYFILKAIIIHNLFGVDLMEEAVEICKLRLFLKLVSQVDSVDHLEPLPDIDFNIRPGNTLVGFASRDHAKAQIDREQSGQGKFQFTDALQTIDEKCQLLETMLAHWRKLQETGKNTGEEKQAYRDGLDELRKELDEYLAHDYGIDTSKPQKFKKWLESHRPFHWFVEFHSIMAGGGFDAIIGNPPYIAASKVRKEYKLLNYATEGCSDIYANVLERVATLLRTGGRSGMIVPLSLTFSRDFASLRSFLSGHYSRNWFSSFARIPAALFSADVRVRNTIHIGCSSDTEKAEYSTVLHRWFEAARPHLFSALRYAPIDSDAFGGLIPKIGQPELSSAIARCFSTTSKRLGSFFSPSKTAPELHFKKSAYNWLNFCLQQPPCFDNRNRRIPHTQFGLIRFRDEATRDMAFLFLNGKIMYVFWAIVGDDFHVTEWMFADFPIDLSSIASSKQKKLLALAGDLEEAMEANVSYKMNAGKKVGNYNLAMCRSVTDQSDAIFAEHLGLSEVWPNIDLAYSQLVKTTFDCDNT